MTNWADKSGENNIYLTPDKILEPVRHYFSLRPCGRILLDPATEESNPVNAASFYTEKENGLLYPWISGTFVNPPYSKGAMPVWVEKIAREAAIGCEIIALLPCGARFSTKYWQNNALSPGLTAICFVRGRVKFKRANGEIASSNPYDSQIYGYNVHWDSFKKSFSPIGKTLKIIH